MNNIDNSTCFHGTIWVSLYHAPDSKSFKQDLLCRDVAQHIKDFHKCYLYANCRQLNVVAHA